MVIPPIRVVHLIVVLVLLAGVHASGCGGDSDNSTHRYVNHEFGYSVEVPTGWHVSEKLLVPQLLDPKEILSVGTYSMPPGGCDHGPLRASEAAGPKDALISVQEASTKQQPPFPPRPEHFRFKPSDIECLPPPPGGSSTRFDFSDAGRNFYALVTLGRDADEQEVMDGSRQLCSAPRFRLSNLGDMTPPNAATHPLAGGARRKAHRPCCLPQFIQAC
jgi:hypothetical protein